jgi:hypothetical protein
LLRWNQKETRETETEAKVFIKSNPFHAELAYTSKTDNSFLYSEKCLIFNNLVKVSFEISQMKISEK